MGHHAPHRHGENMDAYARRLSASRWPPRAVRGGSAPPAPSARRSRQARPMMRSRSPDTPIAACTCARHLNHVEPAAAHVDEVGLQVDQATGCRVSGPRLAAEGHRRDVRRLGPKERAVARRDAPVEGAVGSAISSVRERVRRSDTRGQERACTRACGGRTFEHMGGGKGRPLTLLRPFKKSSLLSSSCSRLLREGAHGRTVMPAQHEGVGLTPPRTRLSISEVDRWEGRRESAAEVSRRRRNPRSVPQAHKVKSTNAQTWPEE